MRNVRTALALVATVGAFDLPWPALASHVIEVAQKGRAFAVREVEIARGDVLRFTNADEFPHQIQAKGPGVDVDSGLQAPGETLDIAFPATGTVELRCGMHPRMRMSVRVR